MKPTVHIEVAKTLRDIRHRLGLSQDEVAKRGKVQRTTLVNIENQTQGIPIPTLERMAWGMGYDIEVVFRRRT